MHHDTTRVSLFNRRIPGHTVLAVCGELDIATTTALRSQIRIILKDTTTPVIIDLSGVSFCDASGLALLVGAQRRARLHGLTVLLAAPGRNGANSCVSPALTAPSLSTPPSPPPSSTMGTPIIWPSRDRR